MMTDPVSDMLTRIRNAAMARHERTIVPASLLKKHIAEILKSEGFIADVRDSEGDPRSLTIVLKYGRDRTSAIDGIKRVSRPGRRVYVSVKNIPSVANGLGVSIMSTPKGVMADHEAKSQNLGGEVLCRVF